MPASGTRIVLRTVPPDAAPQGPGFIAVERIESRCPSPAIDVVDHGLEPIERGSGPQPARLPFDRNQILGILSRLSFAFDPPSEPPVGVVGTIEALERFPGSGKVVELAPLDGCFDPAFDGV